MLPKAHPTSTACGSETLRISESVRPSRYIQVALSESLYASRNSLRRPNVILQCARCVSVGVAISESLYSGRHMRVARSELPCNPAGRAASAAGYISVLYPSQLSDSVYPSRFIRVLDDRPACPAVIPEPACPRITPPRTCMPDGRSGLGLPSRGDPGRLGVSDSD